MEKIVGWIVGWVVLGTTLMHAEAAEATSPVVGHPAPAFTLRTIDGRTVSNATFRGRTLVINVWGSWCPPCRMETPDLIAAAKAWRGRAAFLGVDTTETPSVARAFAAAKGIAYSQVVTPGDSAFTRAYDIRNFPTTFVIDAQGVLRAQHADNILPRQQLEAYLTAAQRGRSAPLVSDEQSKLDRLLDPTAYPLHGEPASVVVNAYAAAAAIARAEDDMDDAMTDPARDHDLIATHAREQTLRNAVITAFAPLARSAPDRAFLARLRGDQAIARGDWPDAEAAYDLALAREPADLDALSGASYAAGQRGAHARVALLDERIAAIAPSYSSEIGVARSQAQLGHRDAALGAIDRAVVLARAKGPAQLAWTHLYGGRAAVRLGDLQRAQYEFVAAGTTAAIIPRSNPRRVMYLEEAQEARVALSLGGGTQAGVSLAPWTGPELPGSVASTFKYRLAVTGQPAASIDLTARGLPKGWIGSFCSDRLCSPFTTTVVVPSVGVKIVEFQVIPGDGAHARPVVKIEAASRGKVLAAASTVVTQ